ncbi:hypothetical protein ACN2C7_01985 [Caulobacter sp. ErkDOM-E]|uniref:hypothetical protein n=1 Tax=Caulobacter sp. ErkDOM-E TaxID=3402778 RepID=UPI003AF4F649
MVELLFLFAVFAWPMVQFLILPVWIWRVTPARDELRIKRDFEGQGRRVIMVRRIGTDWGSRSVPTYRKYEVTVERHDGPIETFKVGVAFTLGPDPAISDDEPERRKAFFKGSQSFFLNDDS